VEALMRGKLTAVGGLLLTAVCVAALSGCVREQENHSSSGGRDGEVEAALKEVHAFTGEVIRKVESAADPSAGVGEAQRYLDARRTDIKTKVDSLRNISDEQLSEAMRGRKMESLTDDFVSVNSLQIKFMTNAMNDAVFKSKLEKLLNDYRALVDV